MSPRSLIVPLFVALAATTSAARAEGPAVGVQAGTLGLGVSLTLDLTETLNVRGLINGASTDYDDDASGIDYAFDLDLASYGAMLDWHVFGGGFRVSAGAFINDNEISGVGFPQPGSVVEIGDVLFDADDIDRTEASLGFDDFAPYVGIGWGNAVGPGKRFGVTFDLGVYLQGAPQASFRAFASPSAPAGAQALLDAEVAREQAEIQNDLDDFEFYPVLSLGLSYKF
ncbi:MAG: hypothetical protein V2I63_02475 [Pseudomonadales bacterium]|nr:hypothetical protein [Pseudomonadales bacterium]